MTSTATVPDAREGLYTHLRLALSLLEDESAHEPMREVAWAWAAKVIEFLHDERSLSDALAVVQRAIRRGDEERARHVLSAIARWLPEDGVAVARLGDQACARGLLRVLDVAARELRHRELPVPASWSQAQVDDSRRDWSVSSEEHAPRAQRASSASDVLALSPRQAERALLSRIVVDPDAFETLRDLIEPEHLETAGHRLVLKACDALRSEGRSIDIVQVARWLREHDLLDEAGGLAFLTQLLNDAVFGGESSEDALVSRLVVPERLMAYPLKTVLHETFDRIARANVRTGRITGIPTGFDDYDRLTGGLHDGEVTVIAGPRGIGTTSLALNVAIHVASRADMEVSASDDRRLERYGVLVFSLGTPRRHIVNRMLCSEAGVEFGKVRNGMLTKRDWEKLTQAAGRLAGLHVWVKDEADLGERNIRDAGARLKAEYERIAATGERTHRIGLIVIDGLQRVRGGRRVRRRLRDIARELMVPIIATMDVHVEETDASNRLESSDTELTEDEADTLCLLHREGYHKFDADPEVAEVFIAWQSSGPSDTVHLRCDSTCMRFQGLPGSDGDAWSG